MMASRPTERTSDASSRRVGDDTLRKALVSMAAEHLPGYASRLTPHVLRHFAASDLYQSGTDIVALQELLGHEWLHTTMIYVNPRELHQAGENPQVAWSRTRKKKSPSTVSSPSPKKPSTTPVATAKRPWSSTTTPGC
ncbi:tyrosine-type recombinase/integrase [Streptomyces sp. NPDC057908]|uniref:tyrosine-type recombinase/integrase n=1 Tax=Streptomyces sp. NPDC057908 TaxID=3346276 RepID=UPI0036E24204